MRTVRRDGRALGVVHQGADGESGRLAAAREVDGLLDRQIPRVVEIQIHRLPRQQFGRRQAGCFVLGGEARDRQCGLDRVPQRPGGEIGGRGVAAPLAEVDADADALVAVEFDGLDRALPDGDRLADALGDIGFAGGGAAALGMAQHVGGEFAQPVCGE